MNDETNSTSNEYSGDSKDFYKEYVSFCNEKNITLNPENNRIAIAKKPFYFLCSDFQHSLPTITFIGNLLQIVCNCGIKEDLTYEQVFKRFIFNDENIDKISCFKCQKGGHGMKEFQYYCHNCKSNLCKYCARECTDEKIILSYQNEKINVMIKDINEKLNNNNIIDFHLKIIIETLIKNFTMNSCESRLYHYSYYANIKSIHDYLTSI